MAADADHNGVINQMDYLVWQTRFAEAYGSAAGVSSGAGAVVARRLFRSRAALSCCWSRHSRFCTVGAQPSESR